MKSDRDNRKRPGTASEHPTNLQSIFKRIGGWFNNNNTEHDFIDHVVNAVEPKLKLAKDYRKKLLGPIDLCREHCKAMVAEIPGPIYLKESGYYDDPAINAAFLGSARIENLLKRADGDKSQPKLSGTERFALLTMKSKERTVFGSKQQDDMILSDIAMRCITFTDHNIVGLATTLSRSREALEKFTFDIIVEATARELSEIRTRLVDLRQRQERLRSMKKMFGDRTCAGLGCVFVPFDPERQTKKDKIEKMLAETSSELAAARNESEGPEDWLTIVENILSKPEDILNIQLVSLRLNWSNILTDDPNEKANTITLATFTLADEMQREGILVSYEQI
ncbi:MAG: hypothetical protein ACI8ZB_004212 [Desulforhopalus sp.]|jgi:hypothetical protein